MEQVCVVVGGRHKVLGSGGCCRSLFSGAHCCSRCCVVQALEKGLNMMLGMKDKMGGLMAQFGMGGADLSRLDDFKAVSAGGVSLPLVP